MATILDNKSPLGKLILKKTYLIGKNQKWLAEKCGIKSTHVSKICNGKIKNPDIKTLRKISQVLEIEISDLYQAVAENFENSQV